MDYNKYFSADVPSFLRSPVREIFRKVDLLAICSFAGGYPSESSFPMEEIGRLSKTVLEKYGSKALQYGATQGVPELREEIARCYGVPVSQVQITTSSQQGIDVCTRVLADPGDIILAPEPVYLGALQSFSAYRATVLPLPSADLEEANYSPERVIPPEGVEDFQTSDSGGTGEARIIASASLRPLPPDEPAGPSLLRARGWARISGASPVPPDRTEGNAVVPERVVPPEGVAARGLVNGRGPQAERSGRDLPSGEITLSGKAKFIYVIPDFNNPTGRTMSLEERKGIVRIAEELDVLIVEDSPYRELRYSGEALPTIRSLAPERTLQLGSFSKIFAPGFRLGWIIGPEEVLEQIYVCKQCLDLCPPVFDQYMAAEFLASGALDLNLEKTKATYRRRRDMMLSLLEKHMPEGVLWNHPDGGLFLWLTLPESVDTVEMYDEALSKGVAYVAGSFFYPDGSHRNTMRLNYTYIAEEKMATGITILADIIKSRI